MAIVSQLFNYLSPASPAPDAAVKAEPEPVSKPAPEARVQAESYVNPVIKAGQHASKMKLQDTSKPIAQTTSKWDYKSPYRGGCDEYVLENPPTGLPTGLNTSGNRWTVLGNGAFHYSNYGTDRGFYVQNTDGSTYHFSPYFGGTYTASSERW